MKRKRLTNRYYSIYTRIQNKIGLLFMPLTGQWLKFLKPIQANHKSSDTSDKIVAL